jgi:hypothetical protein
MTTLTHAPEFAAAVRAALADLPPDELDELTDGLEADLAERAAESGNDLGDPAAYADELRAAAGYPPRAATAHVGRSLPDLRTLPQELRRRWELLLRTRPLIASVVEFFVVLRPAWWVLRGLVVWVLLVGLLGAGTNLWPLAVVLVVLSVQLGRGRMLARAWVRGSLRVVSAIAIIAAPFVAISLVHTWDNAMWQATYYEEAQQYPSGGLTQGGQQIDNIFAYDAQGNPIDQVQLFDQDGRPLNVTTDTGATWWDAADGSMLVPSGDVPGRAGWNVFPLAHVNDWSDYEDDGRLDPTEISATQFPVGTVKPLAGHDAPTGEAGSAPTGGTADAGAGD